MNRNFNTTLVKVHLLICWCWSHVLTISIQPLLRFIVNGKRGQSSQVIISIQPLLRFIIESQIADRDAKHFNTTLVKVHQPCCPCYGRLGEISIQPLLRFIPIPAPSKAQAIENFNTTLVKVHLSDLNDEFSDLISFQYNPC